MLCSPENKKNCQLLRRCGVDNEAVSVRIEKSADVCTLRSLPRDYCYNNLCQFFDCCDNDFIHVIEIPTYYEVHTAVFENSFYGDKLLYLVIFLSIRTFFSFLHRVFRVILLRRIFLIFNRR